MRYIKGHLNKNLAKWTGKKWYHQRFDGAPYFMHYIAEAEIETDILKKFNANFVVHYCFYNEGRADWYIELDDIKKVYTAIINVGKHNRNLSADLIEKWMPYQGEFYQKCLEIGRTNLNKLDDVEFITLHNDFFELTLRKNSSSSFIDGFALGTDELLARKIKKVYDNHPISQEMRFSEVFSALTAPIHLSFINQAEVDLLKAALLIKMGAKRDKVIKAHQLKYFWIRNNYVDAQVLSPEYFSEEIDTLLKKVDIKKQLDEINSIPRINKINKEKLLKRLTLEPGLMFLLKVSEDFTYWQDERKKASFWTAHYAHLLLEEMSRRASIPLDELKYMTPREMFTIFDEMPNRRELQARRKNSVCYWDINGHEILSGDECDKVKKAIVGKQDLSDIDDFRGLTACIGKVRGTVKVVKSATEIDKVKKGDILVAVMTRPDYVPAMKRASAIVTDEGGVTCHAAIIARELNIPCIIGTKIATQVLKDNMTVEVNANHSWVRIIRK